MMSEKPEGKITIQPGSPTVVRVTARDGRTFRIEARLGILDVKETDSSNPVTGQPTFEIQFNVNLMQVLDGGPR